MHDSFFILTFALGNLKQYNMCTITLQYDQSNALARRKLAALLASGLFMQTDMHPEEPTEEEKKAHRELRDAAIAHSQKTMSEVIARYL